MIYRTFNSRNGYHIHCYDNTFSSQKAVVICLHGLSGDKNSSVIARLTEHLKKDSIGAFTFDWPAHGESDAKHSQLNVDNSIEDLAQVVDYVKEKYKVPLYCFATSFGGYLAMVYHLRHPEIFDKIILRSPALNMGEVFLNLRPLEIREALERGETLDFGFEQPLMLNLDFYHDLKKHDIFNEQPDNPERILIIHGDQDIDVPACDSIDYCERNQVRLHLIEGCDHRYKNPGEVERVLEIASEYYNNGEIR